MYHQHCRYIKEIQQFSSQNLIDDDDRVKYYNGLPISMQFVQQHVRCGQSFSDFYQFMLVLMKLHLNLGMLDSAF